MFLDVFFFKQKTAYEMRISDWSSDVCSSDLLVLGNAKDAIETSLEENFFNLTMNPADTCRAFQDIIESEKKTPEDVAKRFGLTERFVRSRLRLADLAAPIFEALRNGEITLNVAVAYARNSDRTKQAAVFELLKTG